MCEGEESDVVRFMELMRTEFFETLNPRGRKLTTRLQERWPLDEEDERYEVAKALDRKANDAYKTETRKGLKKAEREKLERTEEDDKKLTSEWQNKKKCLMDMEEVKVLLDAGRPAWCTTPGVYDRCGCEEPPTDEEITKQRLFDDFTIYTHSSDPYKPACTEAAQLFKDLGHMEGFDAMFAYRFS